MIGTGQYTTGYAFSSRSDAPSESDSEDHSRDGSGGGGQISSDKNAGVVALTLIDLRRRGKLNNLLMAGTNGTKFVQIRKHMDRLIDQAYKDMDLRFVSFPDDDVSHQPDAYREALDALSPGDIVTIFTPDDTHFQMALDAVERGCHVLIAKPIVKTLDEHLRLAQVGKKQGVLVCMEVHKRWDPIYLDARDRIRQLGDFSFFNAYMSQPKSQLDTFGKWAGKGSDISYYLNAHHIDFNVWACSGFARPESVYASAATGVANACGLDTEDTISLSVQWRNTQSRALATAIYTASWIAPKSDVHSQQRFFYMGHEGEIQIDQAHRGYSIATDQAGYQSANPLFMKYTPDAGGYFAGQSAYGYRSIEAFVDAAAAIESGQASVDSVAASLATVGDTALVTAILEAGRRSLDAGGQVIEIQYDDAGQVAGLSSSRIKRLP
jgi:D-galacturonate reductase